jgi:hypothetical protein
MAAHVAGLGMLKAQNRVAQFIGVGPAAKLRVIKAYGEALGSEGIKAQR